MSANRSKEISAKKLDPLAIVPRLYKQLDRLLDDMESADRDEKMTMPQRISGMIALGRIMKMMQDIKKGDLHAGAGSAIDQYATAFQTPNATGRRSSYPRPTVRQSNSDDDDFDRDDDFAAA